MASEEEQAPISTAGEAAETAETRARRGSASKWPGWPGDCVFRLIVPVGKVGSIIGHKGDIIKKMCDDTSARIRVLDGPIGNPDRVVLISGKEDPDAALSPAMDAVIRVFKRVSGLSENEAVAGAEFCSVRMLVASTQAISLIGKQGSLIKSIQESTGSSLRVLPADEATIYASSDERVVEFQGEAFKVLEALEAVVSHLRKFLIDHSVLPLFDKTLDPKNWDLDYHGALMNKFRRPSIAQVPQERQVDTWTEKSSLLHSSTQATGLGANYTHLANRESLYLNRETQLESQIVTSGVSFYGKDGIRAPGLARAGAPIVTQIAQTMQIPLSYAEDIIGIEGSNIAFIRRTSGAILTVQESRGLLDEITVEIKGTSAQVQLAQQLIQEVISNHNKAAVSGTGLGPLGLRSSSYPRLSNSSYQSTSLPSQTYGGVGGYGSSGVGGYSTFRL